MAVIYVVVTDLDGTLLDKSYSMDTSAWFIKELEARGIPVVFCTSKSRAEVEYYRKRYGFKSPYITENGAAIYIDRRDPYLGRPAGDELHVVRLGVPVEELRRELARALEETGASIRLLEDMAPEDISRVSGLPIEIAGLAAVREYSVVFHPYSPGDAEDVEEALRRRGLRVASGARILYSVTGPHDKGDAVNRLRELYIEAGWSPVFIGLGDGYNDAPLLRMVDHPVLLGGNTDIARETGRRDLVVLDDKGPLPWIRAVSMHLGSWLNPRRYMD